ncbi:MAG: hypothetical protein Q8N99_03320 [Nanoarchaeota archaeon]|nr:hypothetical protein [Nanoarchaeota archaeon]
MVAHCFFDTEIAGIGISISNPNGLAFTLSDPLNDHIFDHKNIFLDLYDARTDNTLVGTWDVK